MTKNTQEELLKKWKIFSIVYKMMNTSIFQIDLKLLKKTKLDERKLHLIFLRKRNLILIGVS
ncbi:MAG: hypothetical protein COY38_01135 [Candidatus Aenigmarchaeota archaeon CG_4_10_14_0_8_um_filter_37_24]|nr:MAG: hypothetical protein AUJ50_04685 [Candidatus Aenigmarchaeota archaeon CG1_02_38_14]PIW41466.1 MAG: hypothetical protein COW21_01700 [Candidatus Aenigmarchaeota archaeon CG15_BIG_FIL_POST_REV_8_21_14_020_37_27]PIX50503.1 MAG: hypothetical protein COZ52_03870 [Candidatus Aenigmarchaeota archaeon CG_4_8_14_3_um_filter_37_24]PIY36113.1 MAG: hypothetical protein COZ04_01260 [Candidatus Aenigmarchaeota archaeon CG_4_10_14_3_um_filter_37_21]PIZ35967.1 MAG: hypothetical protein COY38_01135 [Can